MPPGVHPRERRVQRLPQSRRAPKVARAVICSCDAGGLSIDVEAEAGRSLRDFAGGTNDIQLAQGMRFTPWCARAHPTSSSHQSSMQGARCSGGTDVVHTCSQSRRSLVGLRVGVIRCFSTRAARRALRSLRGGSERYEVSAALPRGGRGARGVRGWRLQQAPSCARQDDSRRARALLSISCALLYPPRYIVMVSLSKKSWISAVAQSRAQAAYVRDKAVAGEWDT
eukprot:3064054-Prymnesium_polylepis.1